ncbi:MAG: OmpA family protein [Flavobacteriales bacterium]|nr:OmpA family protein [Flavobacteriales bacterium]
MIKQSILFVFGLILAIGSTAQMNKANEAFEHHHYDEAIELYNKVIRKDLDNTPAITNLAISYWKTDQLTLAEYWFNRAALMSDDPKVKLWYGQLLIINEKYDLAATWLDKYAASELDPKAASDARKMSSWCKSIHQNGKRIDNCQVTPVNINTPDLDFAPFLVGDVLYFTSNRPGATVNLGEEDPWTTSRFTDVFKALRTGKGTFGVVVPEQTFGATPYHEGPIVFSADNRTCIITVSDFDEKKRRFDDRRNTRLKLVRSVSEDGVIWSQPVDLDINSSKYNLVHPALSPEGDILVFASDMPGGQGGMDLYYCTIDPQGACGEPVNLGSHINTQGNELFPHIGVSGTLYFASDLLVGFGGLDLHACARMDATTWDIPENMGMPINSPKDDFGLCWEEEGHSGFLSSNRNGNTRDDILYFEYSANVLVNGQIVDCDTRRPISGAEVHITGEEFYSDLTFADEDGRFSFQVPSGKWFTVAGKANDYVTSTSCQSTFELDTRDMAAGDKMHIHLALSPEASQSRNLAYACGRIINAKYGNPLPGVDLEVFNRCTGESTFVTTGEGGAFYLEVQAQCEFDIVARKDKFHETRATFETIDIVGDCLELALGMQMKESVAPPPLSEDIVLREGMILELFHIYFDRDEFTIREDAVPDLETLLHIMQDHPGLKGELMAHTDSRATTEYNQTLSQNRAEAARQWLIDHGIAADRITASGYGESILKNRCADGVDCTEEEHQRNRRVEFRVTDLDEGIDRRSKERN